jgi:thiol:disulfide interchange protein
LFVCLEIEVTNTTTTTYSFPTQQQQPQQQQQQEPPKVTTSTYRQPSTVSSTVTSTVAKPVNPNIVVTGKGIQNGVVGYPNEFRVSLNDGSKINPGDLMVSSPSLSFSFFHSFLFF